MPSKLRIVGGMQHAVSEILLPYQSGVLMSQPIHIYDGGGTTEDNFSGTITEVNAGAWVRVKVTARQAISAGSDLRVRIEVDGSSAINYGTYHFHTYDRSFQRIDPSFEPMTLFLPRGSGHHADTFIYTRSRLGSTSAPLRASVLLVAPRCEELDASVSQLDNRWLKLSLDHPAMTPKFLKRILAAATSMSMTILSDGDEMDRIDALQVDFVMP